MLMFDKQTNRHRGKNELFSLLSLSFSLLLPAQIRICFQLVTGYCCCCFYYALPFVRLLHFSLFLSYFTSLSLVFHCLLLILYISFYLKFQGNFLLCLFHSLRPNVHGCVYVCGGGYTLNRKNFSNFDLSFFLSFSFSLYVSVCLFFFFTCILLVVGEVVCTRPSSFSFFLLPVLFSCRIGSYSFSFSLSHSLTRFYFTSIASHPHHHHQGCFIIEFLYARMT